MISRRSRLRAVRVAAAAALVSLGGLRTSASAPSAADGAAADASPSDPRADQVSDSNQTTSDSTPSTSAAELTRQGREHAKKGDDEVAVRRFVDAIELDATYGPAYLELAAARQRMGDWGEAERTYDVALERVPRFVPALRARAALHGRLGRTDQEVADLALAARFSEAPDLLRDLADRYAEARAWPAALATYRRYLALMERVGDLRGMHEASVHIRALVILCAELDPVTVGSTRSSWVRRAEASVAKRRGI